MVKKLLKVGIPVFITMLLCFTIYKQQQSHANFVNKLKNDNKAQIEEIKEDMNDEITKQKEMMDNVILNKESRIMELTSEINKIKSYIGIKTTTDNVISKIKNSPEFLVTAYDLSVQSCGKPFSSRWYGITANGTSLKGLDLRTASTISTDPSIIPLGTIVYLYFTDNIAKKYNGLYISNDTGSAIKGNKIDLFVGDQNSQSASKLALDFGRQIAKVIKIE